MKKYPFSSTLDLPKIANKVLLDWKNHDTFQKSISMRSKGRNFVFYQGPPSANGFPGIHHILTTTIKDAFCRYKTMQGYKVERQGGWDAHGLPVELQVEKELGITKDDIGKKISVADYNSHCREAVMRYQREWEDFIEKIGYWIDLKKPYKTCDNSYILVLWSILKRLYDKKLLYKGYSVQPYSPAAGTGLSSHEVNQPGCYKMVKDVSIVAQFQLKNQPNTYLIAWTTTPWTLPANSALAISKDAVYVKIQTYNPYTRLPLYLILAEKTLSNYFEASMENGAFNPPKNPQDPLPWKIITHYKGSDMVGWEYEQLLPYIQPTQPAFRVVHADFATLDGTGIIHIAPTFGKDDYHLAQKEKIPAITILNKQGEQLPIVDEKGRFIPQITDFPGYYVKEAYVPEAVRNAPGYLPTDVQIAQKLKKENRAFRVQRYEHSYPHCWRTDKPIIYYPLSSWFIKTQSCKKQLVALNKTIHWYPASTGEGRFGEWLENVLDWNLTRSRFWGTPLPIWSNQDGTVQKCIGSWDELVKEVDNSVAAGVMKEPLPSDIDLHKPHVDNIVLIGPKGQKLYREHDVIDVWFDAGAMPYAKQPNNHPNPNNQPPNYPADFIAEGIDQTRGWFFTLHVLSVMLHNHIAYKNVLATGLVLDKHGNKMSKRLGNTLNPFELIEQYGPDIIRWYIIVHAHPWENLKFDPNELKEIQNKLFGTLYNTYQFFALYANLDQFQPKNTHPNPAYCNKIDLWILSKLQFLISSVTKYYDSYNPTKAARAIQSFVIDDLSNWYIRLNRKRFWKSDMNEDKHTAYQILHTCLLYVAQLSAPLAPFYMEKLYQDLHPHLTYTSVHLTPFPKPQNNYRHPALEEKMELVKTTTSLVHSIRKKHNLKLRQPLAELIVVLQPNTPQNTIQTFETLILTEVNVKKITYLQNLSPITKAQIKPNFKELGKKYGSLLPQITQALSQLNQITIKEFEEKGQYTLSINNQSLSLTTQQVTITQVNKPEWGIANNKDLSVALNLQLTPALQTEGIARELVNRIQNLRKDNNLAVEQKIHLFLATQNPTIRQALHQHKNYIMQETQAIKYTLKDTLDDGQIALLNNQKIHIIIKPT